MSFLLGVLGWSVILAFPGHTYLLFLIKEFINRILFDSSKRMHNVKNQEYQMVLKHSQWLSGRVLDSRPKGRGFEPHRRHCVVVLEQDTLILA